MNIDVGGMALIPVEYRLQINNTTNNSRFNSNDTAQITASPSDVLFFMGGTQYLLAFNGFSRDGGLTFETMATLAEGYQTSAQIYGTLTAIPVPAALWLLSTGLLALFGFARTKK